jgi:hypothetical protein
MGLFIYASFNENGFECGIHIFLVMKTCCQREVCCTQAAVSNKTFIILASSGSTDSTEEGP